MRLPIRKALLALAAAAAVLPASPAAHASAQPSWSCLHASDVTDLPVTTGPQQMQTTLDDTAVATFTDTPDTEWYQVDCWLADPDTGSEIPETHLTCASTVCNKPIPPINPGQVTLSCVYAVWRDAQGTHAYLKCTVVVGPVRRTGIRVL